MQDMRSVIRHRVIDRVNDHVALPRREQVIHVTLEDLILGQVIDNIE